MPGDLRVVTEWLLAASADIASQYFQLPIAGKEAPEYRERVYCYELYHRWRSRWAGDFQYSLGGEVDKNGHPIIRGRPKPDFLVHRPGAMENLLVVEVKAATVNAQQLREDVAKLTYFTSGPPSYTTGYLWIYGLSEEQWKKIRDSVRHFKENNVVDSRRIQCILHETAGKVAKFVDWE